MYEKDKDHRKRIRNLYDKLVAKTISKEELSELYSLMANHENKGTLDDSMLSTWENIIPNQNESTLTSHIKNVKRTIRKKSTGKRVYQMVGGIAAGIILVIASILFINSEDQVHSYRTDFGERKTIHLPDGSLVELNANSTLKWDKNWEKSGIRKAFLTGEAFFEVVHLDQDQKFIVRTDDLDIEVLGTSFNVSKRDFNTEVYLKEGKVEIGFRDKKAKAERIVMAPGEKVTYSNEFHQFNHTTDEGNERAASWKNGIIYFEDKSVKEILEEVSQLYGIEYVIPDTVLARKKMNFGVPYTEWEPTKEAFELTMGLKIIENDGKYIVQKR